MHRLCLLSPKRSRRWLNDIRYHIEMANGFVAGLNYDTFKDDNLRLYAVTRCLDIISESLATVTG